MVWVGLTEFGATEPFFIEPGQTVDAIYYVRNILPFAKKQGKKLFGKKKWAFQQDGARPHTSQLSQEWCRDNLDYFLPKDKWPPNSPDLNPLDYFYWNEVVTNMRRGIDHTIDSFKEEIKRGCQLVSIEKIKKAINAFEGRVRRVEDNKGAYIPKK